MSKNRSAPETLRVRAEDRNLPNAVMFTLNVANAPLTLRADPVVADRTVGMLAYDFADPAIDTTFIFTLYRDFDGSEPVFETLENWRRDPARMSQALVR